jgi:hypothetical protein
VTITEPMAKHAANQKQVFTMDESGNRIPLSFLGYEFSKTVLNNGLCWIETKGPHELSSQNSFIGFEHSLMPEKEADKQIREWFGKVNWEQKS